MTPVAVDRLPLPSWTEYGHGYGSSLVVLPDGEQVMLSLPHGRAGYRLTTVDVRSGQVRVHGPCRGEVRDVVFDRDESGGWLLTSYGLSRIELDEGRVSIRGVARPRGMGNHQYRLLRLGAGRLGVCGWASKSMAVIDTSSGELTKRVRVTAPYVSCVSEAAVSLLCPHGGERVDLDPESLAVVRRNPMPHGTCPLIVDGDLFMVAGEREQPHSQGVITTLWRVTPTHLAHLDAQTLNTVLSVAAPAGARDVLALTDPGLLVISTERGAVLVDRERLAEVARGECEDRSPLRSHAWLPKLATAVGLAGQSLTGDPALITLSF